MRGSLLWWNHTLDDNHEPMFGIPTVAISIGVEQNLILKTGLKIRVVIDKKKERFPANTLSEEDITFTVYRLTPLHGSPSGPGAVMRAL
jgi:hypothetical protein